jgi:Protein of unknown function (DUF3551)
MRRLFSVLFALATLAAFVTFAPTVGRAETYKWCAVYGERSGGGASNCGFVTLAQCRATISGIGGFCEENQFYTGADGRHVKRARKHRSD